ncbi:helix-turn-helix transcriptional regulator [Myceligenerans indicum]|uniref:Helix-turn-helix transcriptional regulator n=1 Tax=Myceligenerans indicum TaxID=2593663 RepID=A0ABS1LIW9_9MICO|nr:helix-turn-helix transcriptional regulator [Myceligenerans indicum]MBL0886190.1 helix-turn-helix transcriptional regulator [Myceligenerans indicum]
MSTEDDKNIGRNLKKYRTSAGLSQVQLAMQLLTAGFEGVHPQTILKIERGQRPLRLTEARIVADVFDIPLNYLYETSKEAEDELDGLRRERLIRERTHALRQAVDALLTAQDDGQDWLDAHPRSKAVVAHGIRKALEQSDITEIVASHIEHHDRKREEARTAAQAPLPGWANDPDPEETDEQEQENPDGTDQKTP